MGYLTPLLKYPVPGICLGMIKEKRILLLSQLRLMYTVGYSLSVASLTLALIILLIFRKLRCTRNYIHANLFVSFILRAVSILIRDGLLKKHTYNFYEGTNFSHPHSDQTLFGCRLAQAVMQYCVGANYYWVLVEGLYLHNLLVFFVFSANNYYYVYFALGWVTPVLYVVPWIVLRHLHENTGLAKSTLILLPLLGIHMVVCTVISDEPTDDLRIIQLFSELLFSSFQGFLVAILYCFLNKEVQSEIKRKWHNWKLGISTVYTQRTSSSHILPGASGLQDHKHQSCELECLNESGIHLSMEPLQASTRISLHQHHHQGAKKSKAYCYISAHKQVLNRLDKPALDYERYAESYC
ncbi:Glucagon-like peptide 1 receptor [Bagarius yarrelli]|uniref:Glucagon-like peptide 1 receptor n=1 Tax=Bagarius yarrelli TaxID=175774 RepID=A0A556U791_BAGYA|nr:Glucagon-like peptide 1 receptor [Bagarius yarrelli]